MKITYTVKPDKKECLYPYWAKNSFDDLFLIVENNKGIAVQYWKSVEEVNERCLTELPKGSEIHIEV